MDVKRIKNELRSFLFFYFLLISTYVIFQVVNLWYIVSRKQSFAINIGSGRIVKIIEILTIFFAVVNLLGFEGIFENVIL